MFNLYIVQNKFDYKNYVGQTSQAVEERWKEHLTLARLNYPYHFCRAIRKYGEQAFDVQTIISVETKEQINNLERLWIILLQSYKPEFGYNSTMGGDGVVPNDETRYKMGNGARGKTRSEETRKKIALAHAGMSGWNLGIPRTNEVKQKLRIANLGKTHTEESKLKMSESHSGEKNHMFGKHQSEETKLKISETKKKQSLDKFLKTVAWG